MGRTKNDGSEKRLLSQKEVAKELGVTPRSIRDWARKPGFPDCSAGYDLDKLREFQATFARRGSDAADQATKIQIAISEEKLRQLQLKTLEMERDADVAAGNLIPRDEYFLFANETITQARDLLLAIPTEMKRHLPRRLLTKTSAKGSTPIDELRRLLETALNKLAALSEGPKDE